MWLKNYKNNGKKEYWRASKFVIYKQTTWPESAREPYRPSDRSLSAKLVPTFTDRGCSVISATDPYGRILGFQDQHNS
jgi:hypothetical protein